MNNTPILIVEDSLTQALQLQNILEEHDYRVAVAYNGMEALEHLKEHIPSLVISDIVMPEMDGYELCKHIRSAEKLRDIPVILLTALSDPEDVIKALECGADNFVTKPYKEDFLISRIRTILANQELRKKGMSEMGIEIFFGGKKIFITSQRTQIIDLLLSTYENAIQKNLELKQVNNELILAHKELEKRNIQLQNLNKQKNEFLGMAAHDLRNPLGAISNFSEVLYDEAAKALNQEQLELVSIIRSSSEFMLQMVNDFLDISKIESGKLDLDLQPTDILSLAKQNISLNRIFSTKKGIELVLNHEGNLPVMLMDAGKIEQVLNNFISNAIKFSYPQSVIKVQLNSSDDHLVISVTDEGQGIPEKDLDKLFKAFEQTSVKTTGGEKSTGLGLSIVKKIVEGHKGKIRVESEVGKGSTFYAFLPIILPDKKAEKAPAYSKESQLHVIERTETENLSGLRILLAEDNVINQRMVTRILEKQGCTVTVAGTGKEAVSAFDKEQFDLILMDIQMPEMDGLAATQEIRKQSSIKKIPIIAMTGHATEEDREKCLEAGMDDYISKPIKPEMVFDKIKRWAKKGK